MKELVRKSRCLRLVDRPRLKVQLQFEPRDLWVGVFWRRNFEMPPPLHTFHVYLCVVPTLPLHLTALLRDKKPTTNQTTP